MPLRRLKVKTDVRTLQYASLSAVIRHLEQGLDLVNDARDGFITVISLELEAWLVVLRRHIPAICDAVTVTSDADGLAHFATLLTLPDVAGLLHSDPDRIRSLIASATHFLRSIAAYADTSRIN